MQSPFPGMDPYLERNWGDIHHRLIAYAADALQAELPGDLVARMDERIYVDTGDYPISHRRPDVWVAEMPDNPGYRAASSAAAVAEPVILQLAFDPTSEPFLQILDVHGEHVISAVELISPTNKLREAGRSAYLKKQKEFIASGVNLIEIDLVRAGGWVGMLEPYQVPASLQTTYRVTINRAKSRSKVELYAITLQQKLPTIPIPLRTDEPDAHLDLQMLIEQAYRNGRYAGIDYTKPCDPPLSGEDADWADAMLKTAGRR
jgi:hypothetical protein